MRLRKLKLEDAYLMYEWMHDTDVVKNMQTNFLKKTIEDCEEFIKNSENEENINLAIVDENDEYMGTVSLKHIINKSAEFAITVRKKAMGAGFSIFGMKEIIRIGFEKYNLSEIYWCVSKKNVRALRFYDKNGYSRVSYNEIDNKNSYSESQAQSYIWYKEVNKSVSVSNS